MSESGSQATHLAYWDAVAALNTPAEMNGPQGFDDQGAPNDNVEVTKHRDAFLRAALDQFRD